MALKYNTETAVKRDIKIQNQADYTYFSDNNIEQQSQNEGFNYSVTLAEDDTQTFTIDGEVVLTSLQITAYHNAGGGTEEITAYINNSQIGYLIVQSSVNDGAQDNCVIPLPNWRLKTGDILKLVTVEGGAGSGNGSGSFIGYYI